jgi:hypothetical protein
MEQDLISSMEHLNMADRRIGGERVTALAAVSASATLSRIYEASIADLGWARVDAYPLKVAFRQFFKKKAQDQGSRHLDAPGTPGRAQLYSVKAGFEWIKEHGDLYLLEDDEPLTVQPGDRLKIRNLDLEVENARLMTVIAVKDAENDRLMAAIATKDAENARLMAEMMGGSRKRPRDEDDDEDD